MFAIVNSRARKQFVGEQLQAKIENALLLTLLTLFFVCLAPA